VPLAIGALFERAIATGTASLCRDRVCLRGVAPPESTARSRPARLRFAETVALVRRRAPPHGERARSRRAWIRSASGAAAQERARSRRAWLRSAGAAGSERALWPEARGEDGIAAPGARLWAAGSLRRSMAVPKKKQSHSRTAKRRAQHKIGTPALNACPRCHSPRRPHRVCPVCGTYAGREIVSADAHDEHEHDEP
jgi:large subunit ribosomal protein L32